MLLMAKRITAVCLVVFMLLSFAAMAYDITETSDAVTVTKENGIYTVTVSDKVFANSQVSLIAIANGSEIDADVTSDKVAYKGGKEADAEGKAVFTFAPKAGFDASAGLYVAVSSERDITFFGSEYGIAKVPYEITVTVTGEGNVNAYSMFEELDEEGKLVLVKAEEGDVITYAATPDEGYAVKSVKYNGVELTLNADNEFTAPALLSNGTLEVEFAEETASVSEVKVFNGKIARYEYINKFGEDFTHDARTASVASVIFSKISGIADECGIVYSSKSASPEVGAEDCFTAPVTKIGNSGAFLMYFFADTSLLGSKYNVRSYVKVGDTYIYSDSTEMTLTTAE